jgi:hypothetical protein
MEIDEETYFSDMLTYKYLIPHFVYPDDKYNIYYLNKNIQSNDKYALTASIIFESYGDIIPFQYKLTNEQFELYNKNKHDVIDTIVLYMFDISDCKYLVETYGTFKIIKKVIVKYSVENIFHIFNSDDLYCYYTYYILIEYFDNIVYNTNNKNNIAKQEDIYNLQKLINDMKKITKIKSD